MPTTQMTIKLINAPGSTGRGSIVGMDDSRLGVFSEKIGLFHVGKTYEVEFTETDRNGKTLRNVKSAKQIAASPGPVQTSFVSGSYRQSSATSGLDTKSEQIFVQGLLQAMIKAGKVEVDKQALWTATQMLRGLWKHTFGFDSVHQHMEAAE